MDEKQFDQFMKDLRVISGTAQDLPSLRETQLNADAPQPTVNSPLKCVWTPEQDDFLRQEVSRGFKWADIVHHFNETFQNQPPRCYNALVQRYQRSVNPELRKGQWSEEENQHLFEILRDQNLNAFGQIARIFRTRSDLSIRQHVQKPRVSAELKHLGLWRDSFDQGLRYDPTPSEK